MRLNSGWTRLHVGAVAAVLVLSLAACGEKPPPATATAKIDSAADVAARQAKQAAAEAEKKKTDEAKQKADAARMAADAKAAADQGLAAKVKEAIQAGPKLKNMAIDVRALDGEVTLFGTADNEAQRAQAQKIAAGVAGVKSVKNELKVVRGS